MKRTWTAVALVVLLAPACTGRSRTPKQTVEVRLSDFRIDTSGSLLAGLPVALNVANDSATPHSLALEVDGKTHETPTLQQAMATTISLPQLQAGTYTMFCTVPGHRQAGMETRLTVEPAAAAASEDRRTLGAGALSPAEMDAMHEAGAKAFPAKTEALGGRVLEPRTENGVEVFDLTASEIKWEVSPGQFVAAMAYNGQVPGPELHARTGERVRVVLHNQLSQSTAVHFHGVEVPNDMDGVPFVTQPPVKPGGSFTYEFTVKDGPGTYMYHSHHNATEQVTRGLLGAFIIDPPRKTWSVEQTMVLGDGPLGFTLNGKGFPATQPIEADLGQEVLVRFINAGQLSHPMHLHGFHFIVVARDGRPIAPYVVDTLSVGPGEIYDATFTPDSPGVWAFHCHILSHAESDHGMHGMVTAVVVAEG